MKKAIIIAAIAAFSHTAFAADSKLPVSKTCAEGMKAERGAELTIGKDGSGVLVEVEYCTPQRDPAEAAESAKTK